MFSCKTHGWSHIEKPCSLCFPMLIASTSNTISLEIKQKTELEKLKEENARLRDALEFYANESNWIPSSSNYTNISDQITVSDVRGTNEEKTNFCGGSRAREALKGESE